MGRLDHPCCVSIIDSGMDADAPFLVMDYVTGPTLRLVLQDGPLLPARAISLMRQALAGLTHAHAQGIIHRDLKPENIVLTETAGLGEQVRLLDFGLARLRDAATGLTMGLVVGTPNYMPPEQVRAEAVDERTDLYALGVVLFELLTGKAPFAAAQASEILHRQVHAPPPRLRRRASRSPRSRTRWSRPSPVPWPSPRRRDSSRPRSLPARSRRLRSSARPCWSRRRARRRSRAHRRSSRRRSSEHVHVEPGRCERSGSGPRDSGEATPGAATPSPSTSNPVAASAAAPDLRLRAKPLRTPQLRTKPLQARHSGAATSRAAAPGAAAPGAATPDASPAQATPASMAPANAIEAPPTAHPCELGISARGLGKCSVRKRSAVGRRPRADPRRPGQAPRTARAPGTPVPSCCAPASGRCGRPEERHLRPLVALAAFLLLAVIGLIGFAGDRGGGRRRDGAEDRGRPAGGRSPDAAQGTQLRRVRRARRPSSPGSGSWRRTVTGIAPCASHRAASTRSIRRAPPPRSSRARSTSTTCAGRTGSPRTATPSGCRPSCAQMRGSSRTSSAAW